MIRISNMKIKRNMKYCVLFTAHQFPWGSGNVLFLCSSNPQASQAYCDNRQHFSTVFSLRPCWQVTFLNITFWRCFGQHFLSVNFRRASRFAVSLLAPFWQCFLECFWTAVYSTRNSLHSVIDKAFLALFRATFLDGKFLTGIGFAVFG